MGATETLALDDVLDVDYPASPEWSADGRFLAALLYEDDGNVRLIFDSEGAERESCPWHVSPGDGHATGFAWGPESRSSDLVLITDEGATHRVDADA